MKTYKNRFVPLLVSIGLLTFSCKQSSENKVGTPAVKPSAAQEVFPAETIKNDAYHLYKSKKSKGTLVLFPGGGTDAAYTQQEFDIVNLANTHGISVLFMNFSRHIWIDGETTQQLAIELEKAIHQHGLHGENVTIGGMSIGGNVTLTLSNYLMEHKSDIAPKQLFIVDSPIDLYALYESSKMDMANPNFDEERLAEPKFIISYFEESFSKDALLENIKKVSPFVHKNNFTSVPALKNAKLRFYTEPDAKWWKENRQTAFEQTNAYAIQEVAKDLQSKNWSNFELVITKDKGYRSNGERHPHSWSIVDMQDLVRWITTF